MKKLFKLSAILIIFSAFFLSACHEGPAEKKGKQIDNQVETIKDKIQNKGPAQKAGEKLDDATDN